MSTKPAYDMLVMMSTFVRRRASLLAAVTLASCGGGGIDAGRGPDAGLPGRFALPVALERTQYAIALAAGDVTGDGIADVLVTALAQEDVNVPYALFLFAGRRDAMPAAPVALAGVSMPTCVLSSVAVGDINGDGRSDAVIGSACGAQVFFQSVAGALVAGPTVLDPGFETLRIADVDGDGRNDVVGVAPLSGGIAVLRQGTNGTLTLQPPIALGAAGGLDLEVGDVNGDGRTDLVVAIHNHSPDQQVAVLLQQAGGTFGAAQFLSTRTTLRPLALAIGDLNGDGRNDVAVTSGSNSPGSNLALFYQRGDGQLAPMTSIDTYEAPASVRIHDIDGDGRADLVVTHRGWYAVGVYFQQGNGTLAAEQLFDAPYAGGSVPQDMAVADVNGDTRADIVVQGSVLLQRSTAP